MSFKCRLPLHLSSALSRELYRDVIDNVPLLTSFSQNKKISNFLQPLYLVSNSVLYAPGEAANEIYFISKGSLRVVLPPITNRDTKSRYLSINKLSFFAHGELGPGYIFNWYSHPII